MRTQELFDLTGKVAIITGGATGIGKQMAEALAEMGASVVLCSRKIERCEQAAAEFRQLGVKALGLRCDVTSQDEVNAMVEKTRAEFGRIDILVNNSGRTWAAPAETMSLADWQKVMEANVTGTFLCSQAVGRVMIEQRGGKIINISSVAGFFGAPPELVDAIGYHTSKGAIIAFTRDLACKWARYNIYVNAIAPGWFRTHMSEWVLGHRGESLLPFIPLGRFGGPDELKGAVVYLASNASNYVTGQVLMVDGGLSIM
ncbi:MAG: SDR family oxidoreductase [Acidobacteriota bacterium]|nr:SDR family oxidoreductase [Blastocatellia bacterium]MDW8238945.1 SDR family oxidoreductase [Acidobacteriota bacterium]